MIKLTLSASNFLIPSIIQNNVTRYRCTFCVNAVSP